MAHRTVVLNVVGLTQSLIGQATPNLNRFLRDSQKTSLKPVLPAVTCSVQASMLTGLPPNQHGIVGNGWLDRELMEVHFWKQSNRLVPGREGLGEGQAKGPLDNLFENVLVVQHVLDCRFLSHSTPHL